ncbi:MAG: hypothetical protein GX621_04400 [Pirellulaceae bacterium]|nr:hypothetical protein [Pirellulaceae bacterium]
MKFPQYSLRTIFIVFFVVALILGCVMSVVRRVERQRDAIAVIRSQSGGVVYEKPDAETWCGDGDDREKNRQTWRGWLDDLLYDVKTVVCFEYTPEISKALRDIPNVYNLCINSGVHGTDLHVLPDLPNLHMLSIHKANSLDENAIETLGRLTQLETLVLKDAPITDSGLRFLQPMRSLEKLELSSIPIDGTGLRNLHECRDLRTLYVWKGALTDEGMKAIGGLSQLETLFLVDCDIPVSSFAHLSGLRNLKWLILSNKWPPEVDFSTFPVLPKLERLEFAVQPPDGQPNTYHVRSLPHFPMLRELTLGDMDATDDDVEYYRKRRIETVRANCVLPWD